MQCTCSMKFLTETLFFMLRTEQVGGCPFLQIERSIVYAVNLTLLCKRMKILEGNAGALTNFEVLDFLRSRGASKDPTRVLVPVAQSEFKVYDYLVESSACNQTRENVNEFVEKCKKFRLAKAEMLNIINIGPSSLVEIDSVIEQSDIRFNGEQLQELVDLVVTLLPPHPNQTNIEEVTNENEQGTAEGHQVGEGQKGAAHGDIVDEDKGAGEKMDDS